jgi:hypothetical protein
MIPATLPRPLHCIIGLLRRRGFSSSTPVIGELVKLDWKGLELEAVVKEVDERKFLVSYRPWEDTFQQWIDCTTRTTASLGGTSHVTLRTVSKQERSENPKLSPNQGEGNHHPKKRNIRCKVVPLEINSKTYLSSRLTHGRVVLMDPETGLLSWSISPGPCNTAESINTSARLPEGFIAVKDSGGHEYFFNTVNNTAQYSIPTLSAKEVAENMTKVNRDSVPAPWEIYFNKDGVPYFHDPESGKVRGTLPKTPIKETKRAKFTSSTVAVKHQVSKLPSTRSESLAVCTKSEMPNNQWVPRETPTGVVTDNTVIPDGWELHYTDDGHPYFFCEATGESHWELPEKVAEDWWTSSSDKCRSGLAS